MKKIMAILAYLNIFAYLSRMRNYIIADPADNSVTFSKGLYRKLKLERYEDDPVALVFRDGEEYAFTISPEGLPDNAAVGKIQYNAKYKTIGFETLIPTVNRIFFDYGLPYDSACKLSVRRRKNPVSGLVYYTINRPHVQHSR